jgi:23S rRNA (adenine2503-C2)-methyltransferase
VLETIQLLGDEGGIGHKNLVFSTVGDHRVFERLPGLRVKPALALSLHTSRAGLRAELLPKAPRITPDELVELGEAYARATGYPIQYQWTLIEGINDTPEELDGIVRLLAGKYAIMNMIPYNSVPDLPYRRPDWAKAAEIARSLHRRGVLTKLRNSPGRMWTAAAASCAPAACRATPPPRRRCASRAGRRQALSKAWARRPGGS